MSRRNSAEATTKESLFQSCFPCCKLLPFMEMSGSCNKKRKICHQEDEEDDEEKMEKFFALIRSIREARDHLMGSASNGVTEKERNDGSKKSKLDDPDLHHHQEERKQLPVAVWKPSFEREDFMGEADRLMMIKNPPVAPMVASETKKGADQKESLGDEGLDLKLSL